MRAIENNKYLKTESLGAIILLVAAITGFTLSNSPWQIYYEEFINFPLSFRAGDLYYSKSILFWVNDGLVAIFFLLIGLEIKTTLHESEESFQSQLALPCSAAIAGALVPALIYTFFNFNNPINMRGWAIPTAMDTAFILGVLALVGPRISNKLKMFVMSLSIIDDILAVLIIAIFYAEELSNTAVIISVSILGILALINQAGVKNGAIYVFFGFLLWLSVLGSGVHTSIAGVLLAATIPYDKQSRKNLALAMKRAIHPWVSFFILPLFAFANTDVPLHNISLESIFGPLSLGIILGLFIGKQLGVFGVTYLLVKKSKAELPASTSWPQMYGVSVLCGIGFTMSLFIGLLAFESGGPEYNHLVKAAVFIGSLLSAVCGFLILKSSYCKN